MRRSVRSPPEGAIELINVLVHRWFANDLCEARLERQRRVTAGENQPQPLIGDVARVVIRFRASRDHAGGGVPCQFFRQPRPAPEAINSLVASRLEDPRAWMFRDAEGSPLVHGGCKGVLRRLFGDVEIADKPNQDGDDAAPIGAIHGVNRLVYVWVYVREPTA